MTDIDISFVKQYEREVHHAYQRMGSMLANMGRRRTNVRGASTVFQKIGKGVAGTKTRHGLVPTMDLNHSTAEAFIKDYYAGEWLDDLDQLKQAEGSNERQALIEAGAWAMGRKTDEIVCTALDASVNTTNANLGAGITKALLKGRLVAMAKRDVPMDDGKLYGVVSWDVWDKMLDIAEFSDADFVGAADLPYSGKGMQAKRWLGVLWAPFNGLTSKSVSGTVRRHCHIWHERCLGHASGSEIQADITWHGDRQSHFIAHKMSQGAVIIDADGVETVLVNEAA